MKTSSLLSQLPVLYDAATPPSTAHPRSDGKAEWRERWTSSSESRDSGQGGTYVWLPAAGVAEFRELFPEAVEG